MKTLAAALLGLCLSTVAATAQTNEDIHRATGEVAGELQICSVYFGVVARCIKQEPAIARTYREASDKVALLAIKTGMTVGISSAAIIAQDKLWTMEMMKLMDGNCNNVAVLLAKYKDFCNRLSDDADPRFKEWIACARASKRTCGVEPW